MHKREWFIPVLGFFLSFAIFNSTASPWLDDLDSVNFALAVEKFDITQGRPHAPGYPVYVAIAKGLNLFIHDPRRSPSFGGPKGDLSTQMVITLAMICTESFVSASSAIRERTLNSAWFC